MNQVEQYLIAAVIGFASAHALNLGLRIAPSVVGYLINRLIAIPSVKAYVAANPAQIKAIVDAIDQEIDKDIDSAAQPPA